jgi:hypothetical protein
MSRLAVGLPGAYARMFTETKAEKIVHGHCSN